MATAWWTSCPTSGHLVHMATHIDVLCGDYQNVVWRNHRAAQVDAKYFDHAGGENFYTIYRIHNLHFEMYGAMFLARPTQALAAAEALREALPEPVVRYLPQYFEAFVAMRTHVLVRFGRWTEILDEPFPADAELYSYTTAMLRYARVVALANLGRIAEAEAERDQFYAAWKRGAGRPLHVQQSRRRGAEGGRADDAGRTGLQGGAGRRGAGASAARRRAGRHAALRRAVGLDAAHTPRARGAA